MKTRVDYSNIDLILNLTSSKDGITEEQFGLAILENEVFGIDVHPLEEGLQNVL